jgi:hypothetical protein
MLFQLQASGNVTMDTVKKIGETGVTYISRYGCILSLADLIFIDEHSHECTLVFNPISIFFYLLQWSPDAFSESA